MWVENLLGVPLNVLILCLLAGGTRIFVATEPATIKSITGIILSAVLLALVLHPLLVDEEYSQGLVTFLVAMGSFVAKDALTVLPILFSQLRKDPLGLLRDYLNFRQSRKPEDSE